VVDLVDGVADPGGKAAGPKGVNEDEDMSCLGLGLEYGEESS
jgi:hypothetical protein